MSSKDFLEERAEVAAEKLISEDEGNSDEKISVDKQNEFDEKLEKELNSDGVWDEQEIEYLKNNSQNMSNEELKEFFMKQSDFQESDFERFSKSEEKFLMKNFPAQSAESIAEQLDRSESEVERKIEMLGLGHQLN